MFNGILKFFFGTSNDRTLARLSKKVEEINKLEPEYQALTDEQLKAKTAEFKERLETGDTLQSISVEAFATVREAASRTLKMRPFDVQLIGAFVLCENAIAEMKTGEGKTLTATLAIYLHALKGKGVHVVTVNDYLAARDAKANEPLFNFLGLTVAVNSQSTSREEKKAAYLADITYGTNSEFGFDYLRDNLVQSKEERVQRPLSYAIVDEVDSILIDEARTPLVISGAAENDQSLYVEMNKVIPLLEFQDKEDSPEFTGTGDYTVNLKTRQAFLTERGQLKVEQLLTKAGILEEDDSLYALKNSSVLHHVMSALRAHSLFEKDVDYIVKDGEVLIIDEHTGRTMEGRRWGDGNHQAIEAKEGLTINSETITVASITYQNYFRLYEKLAGMTGTADTEAFEFHQIYGLETIVIPTNVPVARIDGRDILFKSEPAKFAAIVKEIKKRIANNQPILVGTASVEKSEMLSDFLKKEGIKHNVLNAKYHAQEADVIAEAGAPGMVTIATNMAGRGTDIILGGNLASRIDKLGDKTPEQVAQLKQQWQEDNAKVLAAGGLHIIGTERHESRRIDNQLRGRSGRQGDPGSSQFFLSLEDNLLKIFIPEARLQTLAKSFKTDEEYLDMNLMGRIIASAQGKVESHNFDIRKQLIQFDDVTNQQRGMIYAQRNYLLDHDDLTEVMNGIVHEICNSITQEYLPTDQIAENWDFEGFDQIVHQEFGLTINSEELLDQGLNELDIADHLEELIQAKFSEKREQLGENFLLLQSALYLKVLDDAWREQLQFMDNLRKSIHLRSYGQKDPITEFKRESFEEFTKMLHQVNITSVGMLAKINFQFKSPEHAQAAKRRFQPDNSGVINLKTSGASINTVNTPGIRKGTTNALIGAAAVSGTLDLKADDPIFNGIGRNEICPCNSGLRFKHCHGKL